MSIFTRIDKDTDPEILLPNRYSEELRMWFVRCPCGRSTSQADGFLDTHFPPTGLDVRTMKDAFFPGTGVCRYSGRSIKLAAALERDGQLTHRERDVRNTVRDDPSVWLGLPEWVAFEGAKIGDRIIFTSWEARGLTGAPCALERCGVVAGKGASFVQITCDEDELGTEARLKRKDWDRARVRRAST